MKELRNKVWRESESLLASSVYSAIHACRYIFQDPPQEHLQEAKELDVKVRAMNELLDKIDLGMIDEEEAKNEFIRIKFMEVK